MTIQRIGAAEARPLEILGISEAEENAYCWLLAHSGATVLEIAQALGLTTGKTQRLLDAIGTKGLTTHAPERPRRYIPASPDIAVEALILQRQNDLQRARGALQALREQAAAVQPRDEREQIVELITSHEAERQAFEQVHRVAQDEVVALVRAPLRISRLDIPSEQDQYTQRGAQARGVNYRGVVDAQYLTLPGALRAIREDLKAGQGIRITAHLPFKMILADRRIALIPLNLQQAGGPVLLIRSSALLDALYTLFELLWERAAPISFSLTSELKTENPSPLLSKEAEDLVPLMAAGLNDKGIAYEFGISTRTLNRRIVEIMKVLGARTRFQMGWLAALRLAGTSHAQQKNRPNSERHVQD